MPVITSPPWQEQGLCTQTDPELFFPVKGGTTIPAKRICRRCPVRAECLQDALEYLDPFGVRGGLSPRELRELARRPVPPAVCPRHGLDLTGGPALYRCPRGHWVAPAALRDETGAAAPDGMAA